MNTLTAKVAIVTGASSGIGHAAALLFAREGAKVVVTARRQAELDELVQKIGAGGGQAVAVVGDVRDEGLAKNLVDTAMDRFGGLDIAFNNVGLVGEMMATHELPLTDWHNILDTNLTSAFLGIKYQVPALIERGGGSLIFTSSFVGHTVGMPGMAAYAASKAGVIGLVKVLAAELGPQGIRANAVLPGGTDTPMSVTNAADATPRTPRRRRSPSSRVSTRSSEWPHPRRSHSRCCTWHRMHRASSPVPHSWSTGASPSIGRRSGPARSSRGLHRNKIRRTRRRRHVNAPTL